MLQVTRAPVWVAVVLAMSVPRAGGATTRVIRQDSRWMLANGCVERVVRTKPFLHTVSITNKLVGEAPPRSVESRGFVLSLDNDSLELDGADFQPGTPEAGEYERGGRLTVPLTCPEHGVRVTVTYRLGHEAFYVRKHLDIDPGEHLLNWVDVESFRLGGEKLRLKRFDQEPMPFPGTPWNIPVGRPLLAGRELFLGVKRMVDKDWLAAQGYDMIYHEDKQRGAYCFADPRVFSVFRDNLVRYVREYGIASYKFDWGHFQCNRAGTWCR